MALRCRDRPRHVRLRDAEPRARHRSHIRRRRHQRVAAASARSSSGATTAIGLELALARRRRQRRRRRRSQRRRSARRRRHVRNCDDGRRRAARLRGRGLAPRDRQPLAARDVVDARASCTDYELTDRCPAHAARSARTRSTASLSASATASDLSARRWASRKASSVAWLCSPALGPATARARGKRAAHLDRSHGRPRNRRACSASTASRSASNAGRSAWPRSGTTERAEIPSPIGVRALEPLGAPTPRARCAAARRGSGPSARRASRRGPGRTSRMRWRSCAKIGSR